MSVRPFAGCFAPRGSRPPRDGAALARALEREGPAASADLGQLAVAWTGHSPVGGKELCLVDGHPRTDALAHELNVDPATEPANPIAVGFARFGATVVDRLGGAFALLAWDGERGVLARDRLGARPLFVVRLAGGILFASEVRVLLAALPSTPPPDPVAVVRWLTRAPGHDTRTLYAGVERLAAAHVVELGPDGWRERAYWQPRYEPPRAVDAAEAASTIRHALGRAVERSLRGSTRPGVMLSGGLDSAAVAAVADPRLSAYSAVFPGDPEVDESDRIARVRDWLGLGGVEAHFRGGSALAAAAEFTRAWELPSVSPNLFVWLPLLRRAAADGTDVVLDGEGGDELFGCARYLIADRLRRGRPLAATRLARRLPGMGDAPRARWIVRALRSYGARAALPHALHRQIRGIRGKGAAAPPWLSPEAARIHREQDDPWAWKGTPGPRWWAQLAHALVYGAEALGAPDLLRHEGRLAGVVLAHPLRDPELIDLMLSLPPELGFHPRLDRPLARRALAGELPEETLQEDRKPAFNSLLAGAFAGPDAAALRDLLADPQPELARHLNRLALSTAGSLDLWRVATLELWLRHLAGKPAPIEATDADVDFTTRPVSARQMHKTA